MPIASLNKIIAIFMVGSLTLLWCLLFCWSELFPFKSVYIDFVKSIGTALSGFVIISICALLGALVEGVTDLTIRSFLKLSRQNPNIAFCFGQKKIQKEISILEQVFIEALKTKLLFQDAMERLEDGAGEFASGIFHKNASKEQFEWVSSHYGMFYLATGFTLLLFLFIALLLKYSIRGIIPSTLLISIMTIVLLSIYVMCSLAVDKYLYTYLATFRFAILWIKEKEIANNEIIGTKYSIVTGGGITATPFK